MYGKLDKPLMRALAIILHVMSISIAYADPPIVPKDVAESRHMGCVQWLKDHWPGGMKRAYSAYLTGCMYDLSVQIPVIPTK